MNSKKYYVYIITNKNKSVLYVGITSNLGRRIYEHKEGLIKKSFSGKYNLLHLLHIEEYDDPNAAIAREKQLKQWNRKWKERLITETNRDWIDLSSSFEK